MEVEQVQTPRKTDPRVVRTRHMLRDALIALILEQGYDAITIQDITDRAGLRRATFYLHYKDKEELLFSILGETFDELACKMDELKLQLITPEAEMAMHLVIFKHAQENADLYRSILGGHGASTTIRYVREYLARTFTREVKECTPELELVMPIDVLANFTASIKLNMAIWWLEQGMPYSPGQMADMCTRLTLNGTRAAFEPIKAQT
jgi:AcrR family transcriptional regulator